MRKSTILILLLIGTLFMLTPTESNRNESDFNSWRPDSVNPGCHNVGINNLRADGQILFNSTWLTVERGESFSLTAEVTKFAGEIDLAGETSGDITIGFNILDEDNSLFLAATIAEFEHGLSVDGDSVTPWTTPLFNVPAEMVFGNYSLVAYAVAGTIGNFDWIIGQVRVEVIESSGPPGPSFTLDLEEITIDNVNVTINILNLTDVKTIELAVDDGNYTEINLVSSYKYQLDLISLTAGEHIISVRVTNFANVSTIKTIIVLVPQIVTTATSTTTTTTPTSTTPQETITDTVDHGLLSNPAVLGVLVVVMIIAVTGPWILLRKS